MTPETKKVMYWGLGILAGAGLVWGVIALIKNAKNTSQQGGSGSGNPVSPTIPGKTLYSTVARKLYQYVPSGAQKCYDTTIGAGQALGTYLGDVSGAEVASAIPASGPYCSQISRPGILWYGVAESDRTSLFAKVSRPGGQILYLGKSPDLYTK